MRDWVDRVTHFTSDQHFWHGKIIEKCSRPFRDWDHMNEELVRRYNEVVPEDGFVVWVGDTFFRQKRELVQPLLSSLHGQKVLVRGNHDRKSSSWFVRMGFDSVHDRLDALWEDAHVVVQHHPELKAGGPVIHGHTHSTSRVSWAGVHVGVDAWDYRPATRQQVVELMKTWRTREQSHEPQERGEVQD